MIAELGHFSLIIALALAVIQTLIPIAGAAKAKLTWMALARPTAQLQFFFTLIAFVILTYAFIVNDFSIAYVANNSNSLLPIQYRISAVWGSHEGSLLLWVLILNLWTTAVTLYSRTLPIHFIARVIGVMGSISVGFLLFMLLTSNPFTRLFSIPTDGADLNPLLQDIGLIIHPPMLYMGYVGFSVVFGFAIAALLGSNLDTLWTKWVRPWTLLAWVFLTLGIALGSWWAYYELGWGGWWFWDPVENASFMPWLMGTALIHSLIATEKRNVFKNWTILLAIFTFSLSLLGTFLVRSGVLTSVHAFATDPTRGTFILALLGFFVGSALMLYAMRAPTAKAGMQFDFFSRETFLLLNSILLLVVMLTVLLGTIYPLIIEVLNKGKLSVGAPYFNTVFIPLMTPVAVLIGVGAIVRWKQDEFRRIRQQLQYLLFVSTILGCLFGLVFFDDNLIKTIFGITISMWIILNSLTAIYIRLSKKQNKMHSLLTIPSAFYGMTLAHIGFALCIIGITITTQHSVELHERMTVGDSVEFAGYQFTFDALNIIPGPNYEATEAVIKVHKNKHYITSLKTQKRIYAVRNMPMTEAGIDPGLMRDLYVSLGEPLDNKSWSVRIYHKPFIRWIWLGALFMAIGGVLAVADKRYRIRTKPAKAPVISDTALSKKQ